MSCTFYDEKEEGRNSLNLVYCIESSLTHCEKYALLLGFFEGFVVPSGKHVGKNAHGVKKNVSEFEIMLFVFNEHPF